MIKYLIIDDESIAHDIVKGYCDMLPGLQFQKSCYDAIEALEYLGNHQVDLIFLDLNMPKLSGFAFLKTLSNPPQVIVTTAYKEFALEGFELNVIDYLLKPFGFERFVKAINKLSSARQSLSNVQVSLPSNTIFLRSNKKHVQVKLDEILYVEATGNYCKVVSTGEEIMIREKISELSAILPIEQFIQVHKSFLVAIKHINIIEGNKIKMGDHEIPVGKFYKMNVKGLLE